MKVSPEQMPPKVAKLGALPVGKAFPTAEWTFHKRSPPFKEKIFSAAGYWLPSPVAGMGISNPLFWTYARLGSKLQVRTGSLEG